ncbi:MAG: hypothetical protein ABIJ96_06810 [Elusimicrobiota bacterium]
MAGKYPFGTVLTRLRREHGYPTAHAFYQSRGGKRGLGLSFANYLALERGRSLPKGSRLPKLMSALGLVSNSKGGKELVYAYLKDVLGSDKLLRPLLAAAAPNPLPPSLALAEAASRQGTRQRSIQLTLEQYRVVAKSAAAYACHIVLANSWGWMDRPELAKITGLTKAELDQAIKELGKAGLARFQGKRVRSPLAGRFIIPPNITPHTASIYSAMLGHRTKWVKERGRLAFNRYLLLRMSNDKLAAFLPHFNEMIRMSALFGDVARSPDSSVYLVESRAVRLFK